MAVVPDVREPYVIAGTVIVLDPAGPLYTAIGGQTCARMCRALTTGAARH
jgi:hypothetical protein